MKMLTGILLIFGCFVLNADAEAIFSGSLFGPNNDTFVCSVTNVTGVRIGFIVTIYDDAGNIAVGPKTVHLEARTAAEIDTTVSSGHGYFCRLSTQKKEDIRGEAQLIHATDNRIYASSEAR